MDLTPLDAVVRLSWLAASVAFVATVFGAANVVGGYVVTDRMLQMFKKKPVAPKTDATTGA